MIFFFCIYGKYDKGCKIYFVLLGEYSVKKFKKKIPIPTIFNRTLVFITNNLYSGATFANPTASKI